MTEMVKEKPETVVTWDRERMLVASMENPDKSVFEFEEQSHDTVWVIAKTLHKAKLAYAEYLIRRCEKVTQTDILKMCRQEWYAKQRREAENAQL